MTDYLSKQEGLSVLRTSPTTVFHQNVWFGASYAVTASDSATVSWTSISRLVVEAGLNTLYFCGFPHETMEEKQTHKEHKGILNCMSTYNPQKYGGKSHRKDSLASGLGFCYLTVCLEVHTVEVSALHNSPVLPGIHSTSPGTLRSNTGIIQSSPLILSAA